MVPIRSFINFINSISLEIPAITKFIRVETENQLIKHCSNMAQDELSLVITTPSVLDNTSDPDNLGDKNTSIAYILKKVDFSDLDESDELNILEQTQNVAIEFRNKINARKDQDNQPYFVRHFTFQNLDPEYNLSGCIGYSWSFFIND